MKQELIAPCGMNCAICASYLAMDSEVRKRGIRKTYCIGCLPGDKQCYYKKHCDRMGDGLVRFCYECEDFPCHLLQTLDKRYRTFYHMSMIENLEFIRDNGMQKFLMKEEEKWRCPQCGGTISCHNGLCYSCQLDKLQAKKRKSRWED